MNKMLAVTLLIATAAAFPVATPSLAGTAVAANDGLCGPNGPEAYKRPGGYCEQVNNKGSLLESEDCPPLPVEKLMSSLLEQGKPVLVADNCGYKVEK